MFVILFGVLLIEIQEEIHHFAGWKGGGVKGHKIANKNFVNILAFPTSSGNRASGGLAEGAGNRRKRQIFAEKTEDCRRKPQEAADWGPSPQVRHLRSVTLRAAQRKSSHLELLESWSYGKLV